MFLLYDRLTICFQYRTPAWMTSCQKKTWQGERIENNKRQSNMDIRNLLGSCKKMPDGQGELVVVMYNSDGWTSLDVFPYTPEYVPGMEPIASSELKDGRNVITFTLNVGNYSVYYGNRSDLKAAQVLEGESVKIQF